ncbi:MAG: S-methyl-5-thioribose-1-phosphate isomerase [Candidatus Bathyarchaeota archaeon]|nr:S-methyl-5-thioribose-1-phosphate isomerase [Candidatus Bathyarchaeota archaeon]
MGENVRETAERIKKLQVQGARNVAIAAVQAMQMLAKQSKAKTKTQFLAELKEAQKILAATRETEPLMRNAMHYLIVQAQNADTEKVAKLSQTVVSAASQFLADLATSRERIAEIGAKRIRDGTVVFTHCHSSTVTRLLAKAKAEGKNFKVICTETRPAFQGRITAREMVELGVETTFIVDSAARTFMDSADIVIVGADAITSEGNVVNKIGTSGLAVLAHEARVPFYVVSELLKFNPETLGGECERIEQRTPAEVWSDAPAKLIVRNPAFDVTRNRYIHGLICEEGIISPQIIVQVMREKYPWVF